MNLPPLDLPQVHIPYTFPDLIHPMVVHLAVALPVVVFLLEIINLLIRKRTIGVLSFVFSLLAFLMIFAAYMSGNVDMVSYGSDEMILSHKNIASYILVIYAVVILLKLISSIVSSGIVKFVYISLLALGISFIYNETVNGMDLVYKQGVHVQRVVKLQDELKNCNQSLNDKQIQIDRLTEENNKLKESNSMQDINKTVQEVNETVQEFNNTSVSLTK